MKIGDKVRVVDNSEVYSTNYEIAKAMGLCKFDTETESYHLTRLSNGCILTVLDIQKHPLGYSPLIGGYCEHLDEDFIINIKGIEAVKPEPLSKENAYYLCYTGGKQ